MNEWLSARADALAQAAGVDRDALELSEEDVERLLDVAGFAAHSSGARTNAPLLSYLLGVARAQGVPLTELDHAVRSTS